MRCVCRNSDLFNNSLGFAAPLVSSQKASSSSSSHRPSQSLHSASPSTTQSQKPTPQPSASSSAELPLSPVALPDEVIHAISIPHPLPQPSFGQPFNLRFSASRTYMLGLGEFSTVYLAAWRPLQSAASNNSSNNNTPTADWALCAVKRINPDRDSQKAAFNEAYILARLGSQRALTSASSTSPDRNHTQDCQHIVRILGVKDEHHQDVDLLEPETPSVSDSVRSRASHRRNSLGQARHGPRASLPGNFVPPPPPPELHTPPQEASRTPKNRALSLIQQESGVAQNPELASEGGHLGLPQPSATSRAGPPSGLQQSLGHGRPGMAHQDTSVRRAISLRDPSAHSGNKPTGSDEADARNSTASAQEAQASGTAPRLLLVYELCPGGTVASFVRRKGHEVGRSLWMRWAKQLVAALAHCHRFGIMHGDVKTQNVMLTADLNSRLCDFGSSLAISPTNPPTEGLGIGTVAYNAPELVSSSPRPFGLPADVFSAGIVLHTLITGVEPYSTCRNTVEQMLHVSRGGYWSWASNQVWERNSSSLSQSLSARTNHSRPGSMYSMNSDDDAFTSPPHQSTSFSSPYTHHRHSGSYTSIMGSSKRTLSRHDVDWLLQQPRPSASSPLESGFKGSDSPKRSSRMQVSEEQLPVSSLASDDEDHSPLPSPRLPSGPSSPCPSRTPEFSGHRKRSSFLQSYSDGWFLLFLNRCSLDYSSPHAHHAACDGRVTVCRLAVAVFPGRARSRARGGHPPLGEDDIACTRECEGSFFSAVSLAATALTNEPPETDHEPGGKRARRILSRQAGF